MEKLELKYKSHVVEVMLYEHSVGFGSDVYSLTSYLFDYDVEKLVFITYILFQKLTKNKRVWAPYPHELSCINFVIKHLRFMLTNVESEDKEPKHAYF